jgi:hypothetical protein
MTWDQDDVTPWRLAGAIVRLPEPPPPGTRLPLAPPPEPEEVRSWRLAEVIRRDPCPDPELESA